MWTKFAKRVKRDPLMGKPASSEYDLFGEDGRYSNAYWRNKAMWLTLGHLAFLVAALIGWDHLDILWPRSIYPDGLSLGAERHAAGMLTVGDSGQSVRLVTSSNLSADWHTWIRDDERKDSSECLAVPEATRARLFALGKPRIGSGNHVQYWIEGRISDRVGPARCDKIGGLQIMRGVDRIETIRPVPCSRDVFVAYGFKCPLERRSTMLQSETFADQRNYYPQSALNLGKGGRVLVRVARDATGSPTGCTVLTSSGVPDLDSQTCKLVGTDPQFTYGARNETYANFDRPVTQAIVWKLPDDQDVDRPSSPLWKDALRKQATRPAPLPWPGR